MDYFISDEESVATEEDGKRFIAECLAAPCVFSLYVSDMLEDSEDGEEPKWYIFMFEGKNGEYAELVWPDLDWYGVKGFNSKDIDYMYHFVKGFFGCSPNIMGGIAE